MMEQTPGDLRRRRQAENDRIDRQTTVLVWLAGAAFAAWLLWSIANGDPAPAGDPVGWCGGSLGGQC